MRKTALIAACLVAGSAHAQIRVEPNTASFVDPAALPLARALFGRGGYFMIAGGVVLAGTAAFVLERDGTDRSVDAASVLPVLEQDGSMALSYQGESYLVGMPRALACPLGRFVGRDGLIAYTKPRFLDPESRHAMMMAGLKRHRIAREFDGTVFEPLLKAADFAATTPLAPTMARALTADLNQANGLEGFVIQAADVSPEPVGSLINTDAQVRYRVYLEASMHRVEISGVPLRYFWQLDGSGAAGVFAVDQLAQSWPAGAGLTDWSSPHPAPTQYDVVNFYQVSGLFRQMHLSEPAKFGAFVEQACKT
jgi:hypothetical protein